MGLSRTVCDIYSDFGQKRKIFIPPAFIAPVKGYCQDFVNFYALKRV